MDENPLLQAIQAKKQQGGSDMNDAGQLLEFILSRFDLVPKDDGKEQGEIDDSMDKTE